MVADPQTQLRGAFSTFSVEKATREERLRARRRSAALIRRRRRAALLLACGILAAVLIALLVGGGGEDTTSAPGGSRTPGGGPSASYPELQPLPKLTDAQLAGQRLIAGFDGTAPPAGLRRMIRGGRIAGIVLFADNVGSRDGLARTVADLQAIPRPEGLGSPLAVAVDQEGGKVKRLAGPPSASGERMGELGADFAARQGEATARSLNAVGINVDLAPVLDVARSGSAIAKEDRSFATSPEAVTEIAVDGFANALREGGVAATAKHFPGFGAAAVNTDFAEQEIDATADQLRTRDELPFAAFAAAGGELIMLSVATYPAFGDDPAALTRALATDELRGRLGFEGVSITDSLDAQAVLAAGSRTDVALKAAGAGTDLLLYGDWKTARKAGRALSDAVASGTLGRDDFETSVQRVLALRGELAG